MSFLTKLAYSINMALEILETPRGRGGLACLGQSLVGLWGFREDPRFSGDFAQMEAHVSHFLQAVRADFPYILINGPDTPMASCQRNMGDWDGNIYQYRPKAAVTIYLSHWVSLIISLIHDTNPLCRFHD